MSIVLVLNILYLLMLLFHFNLHYLSILIYMEFIVVSVLFIMIIYKVNIWLFLVYMVVSVCESVLGLALLVSVSYEYGHQKISLINLC